MINLLNLFNLYTLKSRNNLDKLVASFFTSEAKHMEFLFELYEKYTAGLFVNEKKSKKL